MSWSGGKDSAFALHTIIGEGIYDVRYLLSTIDGNSRRLTIHEVQETLLEQQAQLIGIPLKKCYLYNKDNKSYEAALHSTLTEMKEEGIHHIIFGDLFLEDLRSYREEMMKAFGMVCVFPLWQMDSLNVVNDFVAKGFKSVICSVNDTYLPGTWVGKLIDESFLESLPAKIDPCGENGEYHSFCFDGPIFKHAIDFTHGKTFSKSFKLNQICDDANSPSKLLLWYMEILPGPVTRQLTCARCKQRFVCNSSDVENCQCNAVMLTREITTALENNYEDCLCSNCLQKLEQNNARS